MILKYIFWFMFKRFYNSVSTENLEMFFLFDVIWFKIFCCFQTVNIFNNVKLYSHI